ncbi:FHA domain-containing protein [Cyanobium sp. FGCU-52]|nr:FHA domain-containing protein [Cyanobium sp. FGCU52]
MSKAARLEWQGEGARVLPLDPAVPFTIGRDPATSLSLPEVAGLSRRHAVLRQSEGRWLICDLDSRNGTWVGEQRLEGCRPLRDGDAIRLGRRGPVLVFRAGHPAPTPAPVRAAPATGTIDVAGTTLSLAQILRVELNSRAVHPHVFSWWVLACLGGLLLLPFPLLFWPLQAGALATCIVLGRRREHELQVILRDGRAWRRVFADSRTALAHRNGLRRAIGQPSGA